MKKFFISFASLSIMVAMACLLAVSVSSCGDDDNDGPVTPGGSNKGTYLIAQTGVFVSANTLQNFNVYLEDENGQRTEITTANTKAVDDVSFGIVAKIAGPSFKSVVQVSKISDEVRFYEGTATRYTKFPQSYNKKVIALPKESTDEKGNILAMPDVKITTDANGFNGAALSNLLSFPAGMNLPQWKTKYSDYTWTMSLTFGSPSELSAGSSISGLPTKIAE